MSEDQKPEHYLSKAKEADELAKRAQNPQMRDTWRKIAQNYRSLAGFTERGGGKAQT